MMRWRRRPSQRRHASQPDRSHANMLIAQSGMTNFAKTIDHRVADVENWRNAYDLVGDDIPILDRASPRFRGRCALALAAGDTCFVRV